MANLESIINKFKGRKPLVNIVLDGWGIGSNAQYDAISNATLTTMPYFEKLATTSRLFAHGQYVGLPSHKDMGGSEVGHLTMGAGKIYDQGTKTINELLKSGQFYKSDTLNMLVDNCLNSKTPLHLIGLLSDGNIHSHLDHFIAIIEYAFKRGVNQCYVHALLDGRDVGVQSALDYTEKLETLFYKLKQQRPEIDYAFASGGGREVITMDRDSNWCKVENGYNIHVHGKSENHFASIKEAILHFREQKPEIIDQALEGFVIDKNGAPVGPIKDNHSVIFVNFRADRAVQFSNAMSLKEFSEFKRENHPNFIFAGMMIYDQDTQMPKNFLIKPTTVINPFGKRLVELGYKQFRLAETQKYAHVTFFYNGGYREPLDAKLEDYHLIDSDKIDSFDQIPEMKASEIADKAVQLILSGSYDYGLINFANADMVGHSGNMEATIKGVQAVDVALAKIKTAIDKVGGIIVITADHGNADEMKVLNNDQWEASTKHSLNPVPFILYDPLFNNDYTVKSYKNYNDLNLSNLMATNYILLGLTPPDDINDSLIIV